MDNYINNTEVIVKYNGDISYILGDIDATIEIMSEQYAIITLNKEDIQKLSSYSQIEYVEEPKTLNLALDTAKNNSCISRVQDLEDLSGEGVIVAVIDSGIDYTNNDFKNDDGTTRILCIFDQTIDGNPPDGFIGGSIYNEEDINLALSNDNPYSIVPSIDYIGHGTAVAGIACGNGNNNQIYRGVAYKSSIIAVKLGERGRDFFARDTEIMRAIKFCIDKAIEYNMPICINLSFGTNNGSHTGTSLFETYINDMASKWKISIVVATGNEGNSSKHYKANLLNTEAKQCEIQVSSDLQKLDLVFYKNFCDELEIRIKSPYGDETPLINETLTNNNFYFKNENIFINWGQPTPYTKEQEIFIQLTSPNNSKKITSGIWRIEIIPKNIIDGKIDIWLPVTETSSSNTKFLNSNIDTTLTIPSTASRVISAGGYNDLTNSIADFSGRGFNRNQIIKPDIVAPAVNITSTSIGNNYDSFSGTSMACPFVCGGCALLMQWGIVNKNDLFLYGERIKSFLQKGSNRKNTLLYPNMEWGYGSLCLINTLNLLKLSRKNYNIYTSSIPIKSMQIPLGQNTIKATIFYDETIQKILDKYEFIEICKILTGGYAVITLIESDYVKILEDDLLLMSFQFGFTLGLMDTSALEATGVLAVQNQPFLNLRGSGTLIAIIDTGIDYTLEQFIYSDNTTKITSILDQTQGESCIGTEYTREDIDTALKSETPLEIVPIIDEIGHGTKIASISAGFKDIKRNFTGVAPDSELIIVKLKQLDNINSKEKLFINNNTPAYDSIDLMLGIEYSYNKARELGKPLSICIALGTNEGAHNGLSMLEQYISNIASKNGICISIANGNEANLGHHNLTKLERIEEEKSIELKIGAGEKGIIINSVCYPSDKVGVNIISPIGESTGKIPPRNGYDEEILLPLSNTRVRIQFFEKIFQSSGQLTIITLEAPSEGIWKINLFGVRLLVGDVHSWLPIRNFISTETFFLSPDTFYTVTTPATADISIPVGGYNSFDNSLYVSSSRGPTRNNILRPLVVAPAERVSCIGSNNNIETLSGSSASSAICTGCLALLLEWGIVRGNNKSINTLTAIGYVINGAEKIQGEILPNNLWGFGKLNIFKVFENI